ncbi:MAG TPA: hypothetical protein VMW17_09465 [Candidatus Binatia bacterium]|nr:hypothetical protein [Candidatus Binatia bacterium]
MITKLFSVFFQEHRPADFNRAVGQLCRFFNLRRPRVEWFEYIDWGRTGGKTYENGKIHLVHPENWKNGRKYNSERQWVNMVFHEMGHYIFWADAERKADVFAYRMMRMNGTSHTRANGSAINGNGYARAKRRRA